MNKNEINIKLHLKKLKASKYVTGITFDKKVKVLKGITDFTFKREMMKIPIKIMKKKYQFAVNNKGIIKIKLKLKYSKKIASLNFSMCSFKKVISTRVR